jgi:hypothetical protein
MKKLILIAAMLTLDAVGAPAKRLIPAGRANHQRARAEHSRSARALTKSRDLADAAAPLEPATPTAFPAMSRVLPF